MRACFDVGINAQRDRRAHIFCARDAVDEVELRFAFDVEGIDAFVQRVLDFVACLSDTGKGTPIRAAAGAQHAKQFATGNDVEARAFVGE